ncbi:hypothetical protein GGR56DRAFT_46029 [Xylariaceae sp. FL0804]|nr:hypothetical protein GGR56DRAFT_46029 [Xylariaceae sp. FL0804]
MVTSRPSIANKGDRFRPPQREPGRNHGPPFAPAVPFIYPAAGKRERQPFAGARGGGTKEGRRAAAARQLRSGSADRLRSSGYAGGRGRSRRKAAVAKRRQGACWFRVPLKSVTETGLSSRRVAKILAMSSSLGIIFAGDRSCTALVGLSKFNKGAAVDQPKRHLCAGSIIQRIKSAISASQVVERVVYLPLPRASSVDQHSRCAPMLAPIALGLPGPSCSAASFPEINIGMSSHHAMPSVMQGSLPQPLFG